MIIQVAKGDTWGEVQFHCKTRYAETEFTITFIHLCTLFQEAYVQIKNSFDIRLLINLYHSTLNCLLFTKTPRDHLRLFAVRQATQNKTNISCFECQNKSSPIFYSEARTTATLMNNQTG